MGLRAENSVSVLKDNFSKSVLTLLPFTNFRYKPAKGQSIQLSFNRSVTRPDIYQLNPFISLDDPYSLTVGNPLLKSELQSIIFLEHAIQFKSNYFASRLFYERTDDVINDLIIINGDHAFETQVYNLGTIRKSGLQLSGSFKLGIATLNPYLRLFNLSTSGNGIAKTYGIDDRKGMEFESGLSASLSFKKDLALSLTFQYASPKNNIQDNSFCDPLYFLSLDKILNKKFKIGVVSGLPLVKSFTYRGSDIESPEISIHSRGEVNLSVIPVWFKLSYQFNSGKNRDNISRAREENGSRQKKGF